MKDKTPHAMLFHGTSSSRLNGIIAAGRINPASTGDRHVSLSECPEVASYFANLAASADPGSVPVILVIDPANLDVAPFSSETWGRGACDWEREHASLKPVAIDSIRKIERPAPRPLSSFEHLRERNHAKKRNRR